MNKSEILEHYYSSLHKWEEILNRVKNDNAPDGGYWREYWNPCGFCKVHDCWGSANTCPLNDCSEMGGLLRRLDCCEIEKHVAISEISSFVKLIEKIIKEKEGKNVL